MHLWTYLHLRRELYDRVSKHVEINGRYVLPTAHITVARYIRQLQGIGEAESLVRVVENVNLWLKNRVWSRSEVGDAIREGQQQIGPEAEHGGMKDSWRTDSDEEWRGAGMWTVGEECGLDLRTGPCWYG